MLIYEILTIKQPDVLKLLITTYNIAPPRRVGKLAYKSTLFELKKTMQEKPRGKLASHKE